jgi:hypothetical protein
VTTLVRYTPQDRVLDLARPVSKEDHELILRWHHEIKRGQRIFLCLESDEHDASAELFIKVRNGRYFASHFPGSGHTHPDHEIVVESDEHRRQKDYWYRAADDAGYPVTKEFTTSAKTRLDVAIDGPRKTGVEVQRSFIKSRALTTRTTRSFGAGWLPIWFTASDKRPDWFNKVPTLGCNPLPWGDFMPGRRAATALGITKWDPVKCRPGEFDRCPGGKKRACVAWHPKRAPRSGITVDDVARMAPNRELVPMRDASKNVHLVLPEDLDLWEELTGRSGEYRPGTASSHARKPTSTTICTSPAHDVNTPMVCECGQIMLPLAQLERIVPVCEQCRIKRRLPAPRLKTINTR